MAEIELSVPSRQCRQRRAPNFETLEAEAAACQDRRGAAGVKIEWRYRTEDARIKLKRLYPSLQEKWCIGMPSSRSSLCPRSW